MSSDITSGTDYEATPGQAFRTVWIASSGCNPGALLFNSCEC